MSNDKTPDVIIPVALAPNLTIETVQRTRTGKGEKKGQPYVVPVFGAGRTPFPTPEIFLQLLATLGQEPLLKAVTTEVVGPAFRVASENSLVKNADGTIALDATKLAVAIKAAIADYSATARKVDELRQRKEAITSELGLVMQEVLTAVGKGQPVPMEAQNKAKRLLVEQAQIEAEINKKAAKKTPAADTGAKK
jgi:hypothetical protein